MSKRLLSPYSFLQTVTIAQIQSFPGIKAREVIMKAREYVASMISADTKGECSTLFLTVDLVSFLIHTDIVFTSGGTEVSHLSCSGCLKLEHDCLMFKLYPQSNNMVLHSVIRHCSLTGSTTTLPHVVTSNLEHDSIDLTIRELVERGQIGEWAVVPVMQNFLCSFYNHRSVLTK